MKHQNNNAPAAKTQTFSADYNEIFGDGELSAGQKNSRLLVELSDYQTKSLILFTSETFPRESKPALLRDLCEAYDCVLTKHAEVEFAAHLEKLGLTEPIKTEAARRNEAAANETAPNETAPSRSSEIEPSEIELSEVSA